MFEISKDFTFAAGHRLTGLPATHKCARVHGHGYLVQVRLAAEGLNPPGFVIDYGDLDPLGAWITATLDHRWLGAGDLTDDGGGKTLGVFPGNPTAENLATWIRCWVTAPGHLPALERAGQVQVRVGVSETGKTWAWSW